MSSSMYGEGDFLRRGPRPNNNAGYRSEARRDYARLVHCPAFRRLQGKTQLYPGNESDFFRNRLTHSLEVAQIAKSIASKFNADHSVDIDLDLVEFAGLAHDLGHPPFGHTGEEVLDSLMRADGGFEGNAQTLRILTVLEKRDLDLVESEPSDLYGISESGSDRRLGLNLSFRSLAAVLKYDNVIPPKRGRRARLAKGYYQSESSIVKQIRKHVAPTLSEGNKLKTIECSIMDVADDIAYSTYDLEDSFKAGFQTPLGVVTSLWTNQAIAELVSKECRRAGVDIDAKGVARTMESCLLPDKSPAISAISLSAQSLALAGVGYLRSAFTSTLVNEFVTGVEMEFNTEHPQLSAAVLSKSSKRKVEVLKHYCYASMIQSPRLRLVAFRGGDIVRSLFEIFTSKEGERLLPEDFREMARRFRENDMKSQRLRLVCDYIAGMTDSYAVELYGRLKGSAQNLFKPT